MASIQVVNTRGAIETIFCESSEIEWTIDSLISGGFAILTVSDRV